MNAKCWLFLLTLLLFPMMANPARADAAAAQLRVAHISRGEQSKTSAPDVTERSLDGKVLRRGIKVGARLPGNVRVEVPANVTLVIASGKSTATLQPGSADTFAWTGKSESVTINTGRTNFDDPLDFYHVNAGPVNASHHSTVFSFAVNSKKVMITCTEGSVEATRVGSAGRGPKELSYVEQVDRISGARHPSITYTLGKENAADVAARVRAYRLAAAQGDADADFNLGAMYAQGRGVPQNYATGLRYLRPAAAQGNAYAENLLGVMYESGHGVPQNYATALHYYQLAAAQGNTRGELNLGGFYATGHVVAQNYAMALRYFELADAQGDAFGETTLGVMYAQGHGVPQNYATAVHYFRLAAAQGEAVGENNLGTMYAQGHGVPQNYATAVHYFQLSAAQGFGEGEYDLGLMYENGLGVPQSYAAAMRYYRLAAAHGNADAAAAVARLSKLIK